METVKLLKDKKNPVICGIYRIVFPNGKCYIGQSKDIYKRIQEHNNYAFGGHGSAPLMACEQAIKKYGKIEEFEILERVTDFSTLDDKETYYINKYNSLVKENGYNVVAFGNASNKSGVDNPMSKLNSKQIEEIYFLLKNELNLSQKAIAKIYNVDETTICKINLGKSYQNENLAYPLRPSNNKQFQIKKSLEDYNLTEDDILKLKEELKWNWEKTIENLSLDFKLSLKLVREINQGIKFSSQGNYEYPIRNKNFIKNNSLSKEQVIQIIKELREGKTKTEISKEFRITRHLVLNIQRGDSYRLKNETYPIL